MTTSITTIYDQLKARIALLLPAYQQLANPYEVMENPSIVAKKAFGIGFGSGVNSNRLVGCQLSIAREMTIVLIQLVPSLEQDVSKLSGIEKTILEDQVLLIRFLESGDYLNSSVSKLAYVSDTGVSYDQAGRGLFIVTEITAEVEYFENINI